MADNSSKRRILFVDDDPQFLQMIDRVMRLWSKGIWEVVTAPSASAALAILQDQAVNLAVIDVCMPVVDGLQFLSIVNRRYPDLQKVVLTGYATDAYRSACLANGAE
jgi:YesN/AraC family two-component response regulator